MKVHRRFPLKLVLTACLLTALASAYLRFGFLPEALRQRVIRTVESSSGVRLGFGKALYLPFRGLILESVSVYAPQEGLRFSAEKVVLDVRLLDFFRDKKIVLSTVRLEKPSYEWVLRPSAAKPKPPAPMTRLSGQLPVPVAPDGSSITLGRALSEGTGALLPENLYLEQVEIADGFVRVLETDNGPLVEEIRAIELRIAFEKPPVVSLDGSLNLGRKDPVFLGVHGGWNLDAGAFDLFFNLRGRRAPDWLAERLRAGTVKVHEGSFLVRARVKSSAASSVLFRAQAQMQSVLASVDRLRVTGPVALDTEGSFDTSALRLEAYRGSLRLDGVRLEGLSDSVKTVSAVKGLIRFEPDRVWSEGTRAELEGVPLEADWAVASFADPVLDASVRVQTDAGRLVGLIPQAERAWMKGAQVSGDARSVSVFTGSLRRGGALSVRHEASLSGGTIRIPEKQLELTDASLRVAVDADSVRVSGGRFKIKEDAYRVDVVYPKRLLERGQFTLESQQLRARAEFTPESGGFVIHRASASAHGVDAEFSGRVGRLDEPVVDLRGGFRANLARVGAYAATLQPALKDAGLAGEAAGAFTLSGPVGRPVDWTLAVDLDANPLILRRRVRVPEFRMQLRQQGGIIQIPYFHGRPYGGTLGARFSFDLRRKPVPFETQWFAHGLNLHDLLVDLDSKAKDLSGALNLQSRMTGLLGKPETFTGAGSVDIRDGRLWETPQFKAMGQLPFVKVEGLELAVFRNLAATFVIRDKRLWSQDLTLTSDVVHLSLQGSIGFDLTLDFLMKIRYSPDILEGAKQAGGLIPFVVQEAEGFISLYKIGGTMQKPSFEKTSQKSGNAAGTIGNLIKTLSS